MTSPKAKQAAELIRAGKPITQEYADEIQLAATYRALFMELGLLPPRNAEANLRRVIRTLEQENEDLRRQLQALRDPAVVGGPMGDA